MVLSTIVRGGVALAEEIALDLTVGATEELPIDLVKVVGFEDDGGDDASTWGSLHDNINATEEEVEVGLDGRCLVAVGNAKDGAIASILEIGACRG